MPAYPRLYPAREREVATPGRRDLLAELNAEQAAAVAHGDGPLLVIAGAGSGKTRTLVYRVARLIESGTRPERILLLTFTRRAAQEMIGRVERLTGGSAARVQGGTFHAAGHRLLRAYGEQAGVSSGFSIMDSGDAIDLMGLARASVGVTAKEKRFPRKETLQYLYSRHINVERTVEDLVRSEYPPFVDQLERIGRVFADYVARKAERNLVDYDDLLLFWALMLEHSSELATRIASLYDHLLVDEYQDTNLLQARILRGMCRTHMNLSVVGDDAQSIYAFRGASFRNVLDFPRHFPDATVITLEQNYRSTQQILDVTNLLISRAPERFSKVLWTAREGGEAPWLVTARDETMQTRFVVDRVLELHESGTPLREIAVLFRAGYMSADLEIELAARNIPFEKWGGLKFLEAAHVKDVVAFMRVLENPRDEVSWYRILRLLPGVGDVTARQAIDALARGLWDVRAFTAFNTPPRAREWHDRLSALLERLTARGAAEGDTHAAEIATIREFYDEILRQQYDRPEPRLADLDQLQAIAAGFASRGAFLAALALEPPQGTQDLASGGSADDDHLILSTAHSAKGKEWDAVFVISTVDGLFPLARAAGTEDEIEEERRLMYVAMTRARHHLAVIYPLSAYATRLGGDYTFGQLSRFLDAGVRAAMQRVVLEEESAAKPVGGHAATLDLRALVQGRYSAR
ncbi:MAG: ATP-dependent helicase [Gemmatimonadaceae bacterium]